MAATGLKDCEPDVADRIRKIDRGERLIKMAFEMKSIAESQSYGDFQN